MPSSRRLASIIQRLLPVLGWLPAYRRDWLVPDVLAGLANASGRTANPWGIGPRTDERGMIYPSRRCFGRD
jgi:hypothetical protein